MQVTDMGNHLYVTLFEEDVKNLKKGLEEIKNAIPHSPTSEAMLDTFAFIEWIIEEAS